MVLGFFKERFVWARKKPDNIDADHDKRIAKNYAFDDLLGIYLLRTELETRPKFKNDQKSPRIELYDDGPENGGFSQAVRSQSYIDIMKK